MDYTQYVNIKQGTRSNPRFSCGNTLPLTQLPFGFASFAPQTNGANNGWFYYPDDHSLEGVRLTHCPSPWIGEHGALVMMPQNGTPYLSEEMRWSGYNPKKAILQPHSMQLDFLRPQARFKLAPTVYGAIIEISYSKTDDNYFSVLPVSGNNSYKFDTERNCLFCTTDCNRFKSSDKYPVKAYYAFKFENSDICASKTLVEDENGKRPELSIDGTTAGIHLYVATKKLTVRMATSFIGTEQALQNLENDAIYGDIEELTEHNKTVWNEYLGRIKITAPKEQTKTFYSCLYRTFLFPHKAYEIDKNGNAVHYSPATGKVEKGVRYTDNGFWDTYRTIYPLFSIIAVDEYREMLEGFLNDYDESGWLPRWTSGDAKNCMPSTAIDAVLTDAAKKGLLTKEQMQKALTAMLHHAENDSGIPGYGRDGCSDYIKYGYVPYDKHRETVNLTLDSAYFDKCIADLAELLGENEIRDKYLKRSKNYVNIFDADSGYMRAKDTSGNFRPDFIPDRWGGDYTEASAIQTTFAVQHDLDGLAKLYGGKEEIVKRLDALFAEPPHYDVGAYLREIHEMSEMAALETGQCAICNQPSFHIPFIYAYFGYRDKTDAALRNILEQSFTYKEDGFPGDEDNGSMSAWYIFTSLGFYPITPGYSHYVLFTPNIENVEILGKKPNLPKDATIVSHRDLLR